MGAKNNFNQQKFAAAIKRLRKDLDLNQEDISSYLGVTRSFYSGLEVGKFSPSLHNFIGIYYFFKEKGVPVTSDYLLGLTDKMSSAIEIENGRLKKEIEVLTRETVHYKEQAENLKKIVSLLESKGK